MNKERAVCGQCGEEIDLSKRFFGATRCTGSSQKLALCPSCLNKIPGHSRIGSSSNLNARMIEIYAAQAEGNGSAINLLHFLFSITPETAESSVPALLILK